MVEILILIGVAVTFGVACGISMPRRRDEHLWLRLTGFAIALAAAAWVWIHFEYARLALALSIPIAMTFRFVPDRGVWRWTRQIATVVAVPGLLAVGYAVAMTSFATVLSGDRVEMISRSPDGRWEARLIEHGGLAYCVDELVLVPRGLPTLDPFAYPSRSLGEMAIEGDLQAMSWTDERTLVLQIRPQSPDAPYLQPNPDVRIRVVDVAPFSDSNERAATRVVDQKARRGSP